MAIDQNTIYKNGYYTSSISLEYYFHLSRKLQPYLIKILKTSKKTYKKHLKLFINISTLI